MVAKARALSQESLTGLPLLAETQCSVSIEGRPGRCEGQFLIFYLQILLN